MLGPSFNIHPDPLQFCFSLHFLLALSLTTSQLWKLMVFFEHASHPGWVLGFSRFPSIYSFSKPSFPQSVSHPRFSSLASSFSFVWFDFCILPQAITLVHLVFSDFKECSPLSHIYFSFLRKFWIRQNKDRPPSLLSVRTDNIIPWEQYHFPPSGNQVPTRGTQTSIFTFLLGCSQHLTNFRSFSKVDSDSFYQDFCISVGACPLVSFFWCLH